MSPRARAAFLLTAAAAAGCYQAWPFVGPYQCNAAGSCPAGLVCDDGLCCRPFGTPACPTLVLDGGVCATDAGPALYFEDLDGDGYGNPKATRLACSRPVTEPFVENSLDCDDRSAAANPKGTEKCDGLDNNCDGTLDEGLLPVKSYFRDEDGDGFGDPAITVSACAAPKGYVESNNDCDPAAFTVHPGAQELCNDLDEDCDGVKDNNAIDVGGDCVDAGLGECNPGKIACVAGGLKACQSVKTPKTDFCDTLDNDCDGLTDEQPECGGPASLRTGPVGGAEDVNRSLTPAELIAGCHKGIAGSTGETWAPPSWSGSGASDHLLFFQPPGTGVWDLTRAGLKLRLQLSWTMIGPNSPAWAASSQPVVFVCAESGFNRYVHVNGNLITTAGGSLDETIPLAGGNDWVIGTGSGADLKRVRRIELLIRPASGTSVPTFTFTVGAASGFVP